MRCCYEIDISRYFEKKYEFVLTRVIILAFAISTCDAY